MPSRVELQRASVTLEYEDGREPSIALEIFSSKAASSRHRFVGNSTMPKSMFREVMLIPQILVGCDKNIKPGPPMPPKECRSEDR
jgi:hypothetical protein